MTNLNKKQEYTINRKDREKINQHRSFLIWFTGLSGSGKSTIANLLEKNSTSKKFIPILLTATIFGKGLPKSWAFQKKTETKI